MESYYVSDSLQARFFGYELQVLAIIQDQENEVNFELKTEETTLDEVLVKVDKEAENPAHPIFRAVIANKHINNREKLEAYKYEVYNKIEFDLNNVTEKFSNRKVFKKFDFIFDNIDSSETEKPYLPIFISESITDFYFRKSQK